MVKGSDTKLIKIFQQIEVVKLAYNKNFRPGIILGLKDINRQLAELIDCYENEPQICMCGQIATQQSAWELWYCSSCFTKIVNKIGQMKEEYER